MRKLRSAVICGLLASSAATASAQSKPKDKPRVEQPADVETAEQLYAKLDYDKANDVAERVTKQRNLSHDQLVRSYRVLAVTNAILDKEEAARDAFLHLLVLEPDYAVDSNLGPKVSTPFVEARGRFRSLPAKPGIAVIANVRTDGGQLRVATRDPTRIVKKVMVGYRWSAPGDYAVSESSASETTVEVAAAPPGRTRLDFYAVALDERDSTVFEAGSPQLPRSAFAEPPPKATATVTGQSGDRRSGSIFSSPLFWVLAGAAVAGGGTAMFFALRPEDPPTTASLSPQIRCGAEPCK
ncbi:MAG TPA: hypothetical protein VM925_18505 [Labilithrix sp.]|nr:hypothetical protein [Labilithrix sp.]